MTIFTQKLGFILIAVMALPYATSHSWVERLMRIDSNGKMIGEYGHIRGAVSRLDPSFSDLQMQHLLPPHGREGLAEIHASDRMCKDTQIIGNYSSKLPQLNAYPGDLIALQYQENGHVTLPQNTPQKSSSGMVYVYGTADPLQNDALLAIHKVWNEDGTGGDRRGSLLTKGPFDDGRCYQVNDGEISSLRRTKYHKEPADPQGADLWCQINVPLPPKAQDHYTLYWVWDWPSLPTMEFPKGKAEIYTSCMDVNILRG